MSLPAGASPTGGKFTGTTWTAPGAGGALPPVAGVAQSLVIPTWLFEARQYPYAKDDAPFTAFSALGPVPGGETWLVSRMVVTASSYAFGNAANGVQGGAVDIGDVIVSTLRDVPAGVFNGTAEYEAVALESTVYYDTANHYRWTGQDEPVRPYVLTSGMRPMVTLQPTKSPVADGIFNYSFAIEYVVV